MKTLILLFTITLLSCEDNVSEPTVEIIERPTACPDPNSENPNSEFSFGGIKSVGQISRTSAKVYWDSSKNFKQYLIINTSSSDRAILFFSNGDTSEAVIKGLTPDTEYNFMVRAIDKRGFLETNSKKIKFNTLPWPTFANTKSLRFNGDQAVTLGASSKFDLSQSFTISLWLKKSNLASSKERLLTFHRGSKVSSALSIGLKQENIFLRYRNTKRRAIQHIHPFDYSDNLWHQYTLSYDGQSLALYIDGRIALNVTDQIRGETGSHNAYLAAYTGTKEGLNGLMDEITFFDNSLTADEVLELYNSGASFDVREHSKASSLKTWYRMGDNPNDSEANLEDIVGPRSGVPLNITANDFTMDTP